MGMELDALAHLQAKLEEVVGVAQQSDGRVAQARQAVADVEAGYLAILRHIGDAETRRVMHASLGEALERARIALDLPAP